MKNTIIITQTITETIREYSELNKKLNEELKIKELFKKDIIEKYLLKQYGEFVTESGLTVCTFQEKSRSGLDTERLRKDHPALYEEYTKTTYFGELKTL